MNWDSWVYYNKAYGLCQILESIILFLIFQTLNRIYLFLKKIILGETIAGEGIWIWLNILGIPKVDVYSSFEEGKDGAY